MHSILYINCYSVFARALRAVLGFTMQQRHVAFPAPIWCARTFTRKELCYVDTPHSNSDQARDCRLMPQQKNNVMFFRFITFYTKIIYVLSKLGTSPTEKTFNEIQRYPTSWLSKATRKTTRNQQALISHCLRQQCRLNPLFLLGRNASA